MNVLVFAAALSASVAAQAGCPTVSNESVEHANVLPIVGEKMTAPVPLVSTLIDGPGRAFVCARSELINVRHAAVNLRYRLEANGAPIGGAIGRAMRRGRTDIDTCAPVKLPPGWTEVTLVAEAVRRHSQFKHAKRLYVSAPQTMHSLLWVRECR